MLFERDPYIVCGRCTTEIRLTHSFYSDNLGHLCRRCAAILKEETQLENWPPLPDPEAFYEGAFYLLATGEGPDKLQIQYAVFPTDQAALEGMKRLTEIGHLPTVLFKLQPLGRSDP